MAARGCSSGPSVPSTGTSPRTSRWRSPSAPVKPPRAIAEKLVKALAGSDVVAGAEVAGPGFVNLRLHPRVFQRSDRGVLRAGGGWGRAPGATGERVDIEFVSANPTGPVTVASGRNAVLGDSVARLLESQGHRVTREYYVNDRGNQVRAFAESVRAAAAGREPPEDGYKGAYVLELSSWLRRIAPEPARRSDVDALGRACVTWMLRGVPGSRTLPGIRPSLADLRVHFDVWFSEESLHRWGAVPAVMRQLERGDISSRRTGRSSFRHRTAPSRTRTASYERATAAGRISPRTSRTSPTRSHAVTIA